MGKIAYWQVIVIEFLNSSFESESFYPQDFLLQILISQSYNYLSSSLEYEIVFNRKLITSMWNFLPRFSII